jgi:hypothetical protein
MKIALQYVSDNTGKTKSVQVSFADWKKLMTRLKKYEQTLQRIPSTNPIIFYPSMLHNFAVAIVRCCLFFGR